ncbi:hypothetical protein [Flindersiella endophytica]
MHGDTEFNYQLSDYIKQIVARASEPVPGKYYEVYPGVWGEPIAVDRNLLFNPLTPPWAVQPYDSFTLQPPADQWYALFLPFSKGSLDAATEAQDAIRRSIRNQLSDLADGSNLGPIGVIRDVLEDWDGEPDSAAFKFKSVYLPDLYEVFKNQIEIAEALGFVISAHAAIIDAAREGVLNICKMTLARFDQAKAEQRAAAKQALADLGEQIAGVAADAIDGPKSIVSSALKGLGQSLAKEIAGPSGETPWDICETMGTAVVQLRESVLDEEKLIQRSLRDLTNDYFLIGDRTAGVPMLPQDVRLPSDSGRA